MILGVGVDIVEVPRMERAVNSRWARRFVSRVFSEEERAVCEGMAYPAQGYAARFAAKEAVVKALGTGFSRGVRPNMVHVRGGERQRPWILLIGKALEAARRLRAGRIHLSLTHTPISACAFIILEKEEISSDVDRRFS